MDFSYSEDQREMYDFATELSRRYFAERAFTWEATGEHPWANLKILATHGLTGMLVPEKDGGQGQSIVNTLLAQEAISRVCPHTGDAFHSANFRGVLHLARYASEGVKRRYLTPVIEGEALMALGMSEPDAGSATGEMRTKVRDGGDGTVVVNGTKIFNSDGTHASHWLLWAKFEDEGGGIGTLVIDRETPGFSVESPQKWIFGAPHATLFFDDCRVPAGNVVSTKEGLPGLFDLHNIERMSNAARSIALASLALQMARDYTQIRHQGGHLIGDYQGIRWKLADMAVKLAAARLLTYRAAANADARGGKADRLEVSIAKLYANEVGFEIANEAMAIFGGNGLSAESPINFLFRRTRGLLVGGGTPEILRNGISREIMRASDPVSMSGLGL